MRTTYELPNEVAVAVAKNDGALCQVYANKQADKEKANMARLIGDLITELSRCKDRLDKACEMANAACDRFEDAVDRMEKVRDTIGELGAEINPPISHAKADSVMAPSAKITKSSLSVASVTKCILALISLAPFVSLTLIVSLCSGLMQLL